MIPMNQGAAFENGTSASFVWNETIYDAGKALEEAGLGTYAAYDITPDVSRARGVMRMMP